MERLPCKAREAKAVFPFPFHFQVLWPYLRENCGKYDRFLDGLDAFNLDLYGSMG